MSSYCPSHDWDRYINSFDDSTNCPACGADDWEDCDSGEVVDRMEHGAHWEQCSEPKCKNCGYCHACYEAGRLQLCILPENYYTRKCGWCGGEVHPLHQDYVSEYYSGETIICHPICKNAVTNQQRRVAEEDRRYLDEVDRYAHRYWEEEFISGRDEDGYYNFEGEPHRL